MMLTIKRNIFVVFLLLPYYSYSRYAEELNQDTCQENATPEFQNVKGLTFGIKPLIVLSLATDKNEFTVNLMLTIVWVDLTLQNSDNNGKSGYLDKNVIANIRKPTAQFTNCKKCRKSLIELMENKYYFTPSFKKIKVTYSGDFTFTCHYDFQDFPFDMHVCSAKAIINSEFEIHFEEDLVINAIPVPSGFKLLKLESKQINHSNICEKDIVKTVYFEFTFRRIPTEYLLITYLPGILLVMMSWVFFFLPPEFTQTRITNGLMLQLSIYLVLITPHNQIPPQANTLEKFCNICMLFIFLANCNSLAVFLLNGKICVDDDGVSEIDMKKATIATESKLKKKMKRGAYWMDVLGAIVSPLTFVIYVFFYFKHYMYDCNI